MDRSDPEYWKWREERINHFAHEYEAGRMTVHVFKASLKALWVNRQTIDSLSRLHEPVPRPVPRPKYRVVGGLIVTNTGD